MRKEKEKIEIIVKIIMIAILIVICIYATMVSKNEMNKEKVSDVVSAEASK